MCGQNVVTRVVDREFTIRAQLPHNSRGWSPGSSGSDQNLSCGKTAQLPQNNVAQVPANGRGAVHHLRQHAYKQREPGSESEKDGDEMMAAERHRVEEELPRQTHAA